MDVKPNSEKESIEIAQVTFVFGIITVCIQTFAGKQEQNIFFSIFIDVNESNNLPDILFTSLHIFALSKGCPILNLKSQYSKTHIADLSIVRIHSQCPGPSSTQLALVLLRKMPSVDIVAQDNFRKKVYHFVSNIDSFSIHYH